MPFTFERTAQDRDAPRSACVLIVSSGGLEHNGGIGRQMGYFLGARAPDSAGIAYRVVDSRGPWFLGASPAHTVLAALYLGRAMLQLAWARLAAAPCLAHVNIAGRGSTVRKVILLGFARRFGLRYLLHVHDYDYAQDYCRRGPLMQRLIARMFRAADRVVVLGNRDRLRLSTLLDLPPDRLVVLPNAVPDPRPAAAGAREPGESGEPCQLLFLGDLSLRKGVPELLHALASPLLASRRWQATLAGGGDVAAFRDLAQSLGLLDRVRFPGWVDAAAVAALAAAADILVLPSHAEGLAMAVLEGLAHGLTVITTPVGAHPEVIEPETSGLFVPPGDVDALAQALARAIDDPALRRRLGQAARRRFLEAFEVRGYAQRLGALHADLLARITPVRPARVRLSLR